MGNLKPRVYWFLIILNVFETLQRKINFEVGYKRAKRKRLIARETKVRVWEKEKTCRRRTRKVSSLARANRRRKSVPKSNGRNFQWANWGQLIP